MPSIPPSRSTIPPILASENPPAAVLAVDSTAVAEPGRMEVGLVVIGEYGDNAEASAVMGMSAVIPGYRLVFE
ncbi:hypothetical protein D3C78_1767450 [compost metagenome]